MAYDINKKSDMNKLFTDFKKQGLEIAKNQINARQYKIECPQCKAKITVKSGSNICPFCKHNFDVKLDINF